MAIIGPEQLSSTASTPINEVNKPEAVALNWVVLLMSSTHFSSQLIVKLCIILIVAFAIGCGAEDNDDITMHNSKPSPNSNHGSSNNNNSGENNLANHNNQVELAQQIRQTIDEAKQAQCEVTYRCCSDNELDTQFPHLAVDGDCEDITNTFPGDIQDTIFVEAVLNNRLRYFPQRAESCLQNYRNQSCDNFHTQDPFLSTLPGCREAVLPNLEWGDLCHTDRECKPGNYCEQLVDENGDEQGLSACLSYAQKDDFCVSVRCAPGLYCDGFDNRCKDALDNGDACSNHNQCQSGICRQNSDGNTICQAPQPICTGN